MSNLMVTSPQRPYTFQDRFKAVSNGEVFVGLVDKTDLENPANQIQVYVVGEDGSETPVSQPLKINSGGLLVYNGQPAKFIVKQNYSMLVKQRGKQVMYEPNMAFVDPESLYKTPSVVDSEIVSGLINPEVLDLGMQSTIINTNSTRFRVNTGAGVELLYLWEQSGTLPAAPFTITNIVEVAFGNYDFTINGTTYEFVSKKSEFYRLRNDPRGWGFFGPSMSGAQNKITLQRKADHTSLTGEPVYLPTFGNFVTIGDRTTPGTQVTIDTDFNVLIYGDGVTSRYRRGDLTCVSNFSRLFYIRNTTNSKRINVEIRDLNIDDNASGNPLSNPAGNPFEFQNSHTFAIEPRGYRGVLDVKYSNIYCIDPIADVCNASGNANNTIRNYTASKIRVPQRSRVRFDVGATCSFETMKVSDCTVQTIEVESNSINSSDACDIQLVNCTSDLIDILTPTGGRRKSILNTTNCIARALTVFRVDFTDVGGVYRLRAPFRLVGSGSTEKYVFKFVGTKFIADTDFDDTVSPGDMLYIETAATTPFEVYFDGDYELIDQSGKNLKLFRDINSGLDGKVVSFGKGVMKATGDRCVDVRSGNFKFKGVEYSCANLGSMVYQDNMTSAQPSVNNMEIMRCTAQTNSYLYRMPSSGKPLNLKMNGNIPKSQTSHIDNVRSDKLTPPFGTGSIITPLNLDVLQKTGASLPTYTDIRGTRIDYLDPGATGAYAAIAVDSAGTWRALT